MKRGEDGMALRYRNAGRNRQRLLLLFLLLRELTRAPPCRNAVHYQLYSIWRGKELVGLRSRKMSRRRRPLARRGRRPYERFRPLLPRSATDGRRQRSDRAPVPQCFHDFGGATQEMCWLAQVPQAGLLRMQSKKRTAIVFGVGASRLIFDWQR